MSENRQINRVAYSCIAFGLCIFVFLSLISFDINDRPNPDVAATGAVSNLCGPIGAYIAYKCEYYLGPATMLLLCVFVLWLILYCMQKPIEQMTLRIIGVGLIAAAISASAYLITPGDINSLSHGNGGILGVALGHFLLHNTAIVGASLIVIAMVTVGLLLAADNVLLLLPRLLIFGADQLRQAGPVLVGVGNTSAGVKEKVKEKVRDNSKGIFARAVAVASPKRKVEEEFEEPPVDEFEPDVSEFEDTDVDTEETVEDAELEGQEYEDAIEEEEQEDVEQEDEDAEIEAEVESDDEEMEYRKPERPERREISGPTVSALAKMLGHKPPASSDPSHPEVVDYSEYIYPPAELLDEPENGYNEQLEESVRQRAKVLENTLKEFNLDTKVVATETGPVITMFELKLAPGIKVSQITNLSNDLARSLGAPSVRVVAPIPGKHTIGIEAPNSEKETVRIKELLSLAGDKPGKMQIPVFLGKDAHGDPLVVDLAGMPHCLIAGTTGSGKSVCINSIIISILLTQRPDMVKLILVDPKMVEMNSFGGLAHLMCPIVTEMQRAEQILQWLTGKMDERYALMARAKVRNIVAYNKLTEEQIYERLMPRNDEEKARIPTRLPYIVVVIDELADLMMTSAKEVEGHIVRLAQKSRAIGIHLVLATQRPQATVVTGLIKSNMPCRISFRVASRMDSRIVLDGNGAETLLGQGDMLFLKPGTSDLLRSQGAYVSDSEINRIVKHLKEVAAMSYHPELVQMNKIDTGDEERDELFDDAVRLILQSQRGSVSLLQRRLTIGYSRASRLIDQMATAGIVGEYKGSQAREVNMTLKEYESIRRQMEQEATAGYAADAQHVSSDVDEQEVVSTVVQDDSQVETAEEAVVDAEEYTIEDQEPEGSVGTEVEEEEEVDEDSEYEYVDEDEVEEEEEPEDQEYEYVEEEVAVDADEAEEQDEEEGNNDLVAGEDFEEYEESESEKPESANSDLDNLALDDKSSGLAEYVTADYDEEAEE